MKKNDTKNADYVLVLSKYYYPGCYQQRNKFMVDHSSLAIAVWNGTASGTGNTVNYVMHTGVKVINTLSTTNRIL